ncbi:hypothetical protein [Campylobacter troglodytis]|uniref:hypothetical protein n=1 Tax=Campylobacter troglodytis TaxID=654363 RepID=UPI00115727C6|nr:hypothetical protein [Campylobacter troglodytis]TQR55791.1 hypothetical protein DMC01_09610 [Campylobacter troglodytis]
MKEEVDTFSNEGNFEIHISGINLKDLEKESKCINLKEKRKQRQDHKAQDNLTGFSLSNFNKFGSRYFKYDFFLSISANFDENFVLNFSS